MIILSFSLFYSFSSLFWTFYNTISYRNLGTEEGYKEGYEKAASLCKISGSANLQSGETSSSNQYITNPTFTLNVKDYESITINVTGTTNNASVLSIVTNSGINKTVGPGTYTYDISAATTITFSSSYNISTLGNCNFNYTIK